MLGPMAWIKKPAQEVDFSTAGSQKQYYTQEALGKRDEQKTRRASDPARVISGANIACSVY